MFQSAEALREREFGKVTLARDGKTVFMMSGEDFQTLGRSYAEGENPLYLMRTLPEALCLADGTPAFGRWTGGILGVFTRQMADGTNFAHQWAQGE